MTGPRARRLRATMLAVALGAAVAAVPLATGAGPAAATPSGSSWNLIFADEFDASALDAGKWHTCFWWAAETCTIEPNNELELYRPQGVSLAEGALRLQARKETALGWNGKTYDYTSGMVSTGGVEGVKNPGFVFKYGYVEARVKIPKGQGLWPAVWMLPANHAWPPEIDVMEIIGSKPTEQNMTYHFLKPDGTQSRAGQVWSGPDFSADWHTFGVDWQPDAIVWYVDGVERARYSDAATITAEPSYVLLNLAVGGNWAGPPDAGTPFPSTYLVDYVRVYQKSSAAPPNPAPVAAAPVATITASGHIGTATVPVRLSWSATDADGIAGYRLEQSSDGGVTWTAVGLAAPSATSVTVNVAPTASLRYRVRATDTVGAVGAYATGPTFPLSLLQQNVSALTYPTGTWATYKNTSASGGSYRASRTAGAKAILRFTGTQVNWIGTTASNRGKAAVYLDGIYQKTVDSYSATTQARRILFNTTMPAGQHTLEVRPLGTRNGGSSGHYVDVDAFVTAG